MKKIVLQKKLDNLKAQCLNCPHYCELNNHQKGFCHVRQNINGQIFNDNYGEVTNLLIQPIEKLSIFHFLPGTETLSLGCLGCNMMCQNCQTWHLSQRPRLASYQKPIEPMTPEEIVALAKKEQVKSITYAYTEPAIFSEFALETMKLAKKEGIKNIWDSNGFLSSELIEEVSPFLDAINIDLKSFDEKFYRSYCKAKLDPILKAIKSLKEKNIWIEISTLIIPGQTDDKNNLKNIALFIKNELGEKTPWHVNNFSPDNAWQTSDKKTSPDIVLQKVKDLALQIGLKYVYLGNINLAQRQDTTCPKCSNILIERNLKSVVVHATNGSCPHCQQKTDII